MHGSTHARYTLMGDIAAAKAAVQPALEAEGFTITEQGDSEWKATHGHRAPSSVLLGALGGGTHAHQNFTVTFTVGSGTVDVDLHHPLFQMATGDMAPVETYRLEMAYRKTEADLRDRFQAAGSSRAPPSDRRAPTSPPRTVRRPLG